jgi:hypothetical protein
MLSARGIASDVFTFNALNAFPGDRLRYTIFPEKLRSGLISKMLVRVRRSSRATIQLSNYVGGGKEGASHPLVQGRGEGGGQQQLVSRS